MQLRKQARKRTRPATVNELGKTKGWSNTLLADLPADVLRKLGKLPQLEERR